MSATEVIEKLVREKAEGVKREFIESLEGMAESRRQRFEAEIDQIVQSLKIQLPAPSNVFDILVKGGKVHSKEFGLSSDETDVRLEVGNDDIFYDERLYRANRLPSGKYRFTLVIERIGDAPKRDC